MRKHAPIKIAIQLAHAGRKASSEVPWQGGANIPPDHAARLADRGAVRAAACSRARPCRWRSTPPAWQRVKDGFAAAARRADALGLDAIELHGAHGYLLHQFLSPLSNRRTDDYGGSLENRMRFPLEVFEAVRAAVSPEMVVGMRISATDWVDGGWDLEQSIALAQAAGSSAAASSSTSRAAALSPQQKIPVGPGYQIEFAARIKAATGHADHRRRPDHRGQAGRDHRRRPARPTWWRWRARCCTTRAGPGMRRRSWARRSSAPPQYWRSQPHEFKHLFGDTRLGQR